MKIAIPTNDRQTIAERTGRCKEFAIIDIEIIAVLDGVDMLIVKMVGKHLKNDLETHAIPYRQTTETEIVNIIKEQVEL